MENWEEKFADIIKEEESMEKLVNWFEETFNADNYTPDEIILYREEFDKDMMGFFKDYTSGV